MERQDGIIMSQKEKTLGHFRQEGAPAVLGSADATRRMSARKKSLAWAVRSELICDFKKDHFSDVIEELARVQRV